AVEPYSVGVHTITWTVEDINGNANTCQQTLTVIEEELPEITCPQNVSVNTDADLCSASGVVLDDPITSDNCGVYSVVNDAPETFETGETTVIWTVTDNNGNIATCSQVVTVTDNQAPAIVCPPNVSVPFDEGENTASNVDLGNPETSDNCGIQSIENDAVEPYPVGITTVTWTVTDVNGNTASCTQSVTVYDPIYVEQFTRDGKNFISNYPNPFNNATTIEFGIVHNSKVSITIVDLYGRKIASLFDGVVFEKGVHHFNFNSNSYNLCPGEYIIQLQTGNKMVTNKMMVE
ncbi:MAG TPA: HYR domain-containing protein, partial [Bacteroidales bacterium]|nr:HYR domain-containing protein [Bacteroidales bacterium]